MFRLPRPFYTAKPFFFLVASLCLMVLTEHVIVTLFALYLICYALWILVTRFIWRDFRAIEYLE